MTQHRRFAASLALALALVPTAPALADTESWNWLEVRLPLSDGSGAKPNSLRFFTDYRFSGRFSGLYMSFFRVGPLWELHPNLLLAVHATALADQPRPGVYEQEHRLEFEPNLRGNWGDIAVNDRNRLEYRWRPSGALWRYRNQLWLNYQPVGATWIPFVWDEVLVDLNGPLGAGFHQNRASVGIGRMLSESTRLNLGYMLRSRQVSTTAWEHDNIALVNLFFAPRVESIFKPQLPDADL